MYQRIIKQGQRGLKALWGLLEVREGRLESPQELSISAKDEIESNRFGPRSYYYDRRYFYLDDDIETEERFVLRLTIKDKAEDKSLWTGFTSWNQNRLNDSSDTETIQALVNSLLQEL